MANRMWKCENSDRFHFHGIQNDCGGDCRYEGKRRLLLGRKAMKNPDGILKSRDTTLPTNIHSQSYGLSDSYVQLWMSDHKEGWCRRIDAFELWWLSRLFESPLDSKGIKPIKPKGNQPGICIGRTCAEAEAPVLWPPDVKSRFIGKGPDAGKDWRQEEKGTTEDEMVRLHHWLNGHEFEQTPGDSVGQRSLARCSPWSCKESDTTWRLNDSFQVVSWCHSLFTGTLAVSVSPWVLRI